jgi:uncharacterized protein YpuA (DUF1002 family)
MKSVLIISIVFLILFSSCKSEEEKPQNTPKQGDTYVLPPTEQQPPVLEKQANIDPNVAEEIISVIKENIAATQAEDKERVLKTVHKDSPQMRSTREGMDYVFNHFDMEYNLERAEVIAVNNEEARVYYVQTTRARSGSGFQPMRSAGIHILKKENGEWKIFKTEYLGNEPIE